MSTMKKSETPAGPWRIAVIWTFGPLLAQHCLAGLYQLADQTPDVQIRKFDADATDFQQEVLQALRQWRPQGMIVRLVDWDRLKKLRRQFPEVPMVATVFSPAGLVDTCVVADASELVTLARDHFQKCGLNKMALYCCADKCAMASRLATFRAVVPDGVEIICPRDVAFGSTAAMKKRADRIITDGLRGLPKPVGVLTLETSTAPALLGYITGKLGLRVPQDVQVIGLDQVDQCLGCQPHLTSLSLPNERIGQTALETMLRYLRHEQPPPPPLIGVPGGIINLRGSTRPVVIGEEAVSRALQQIQVHAAKGITATRVAKLSKVGRTTFYKQFGAATGGTPARHLRQLRLQEACRKLKETDDTVTAVAKDCGFRSLISFVQFFRRQTGQTPTAYRQQQTRLNSGVR